VHILDVRRGDQDHGCPVCFFQFFCCSTLHTGLEPCGVLYQERRNALVGKRLPGDLSLSQLDNIFATVDREYERNRIVDAYSRRHARNAHYTYFNRANQLLLHERL
jgi:hypothetical protein